MKIILILTLNNVTKSYGDKVVVNNLNFTIDEPGAFGLIGTNGAGKTTTIRMILGVTSCDSGSITWNGKPVSRETVKFGYMPEERGIYPKVKIIEQLIYFGMLRGMNRSDAAKSADKWLDRFAATEYRNITAEKLSKGNQQKIQFITTVIHDPALLFLDEPFSGFDPVNAEVFNEVIHELIDAKKYIVMSSHQMSSVEKYCKDIVLLHRGNSILQGNLREIKEGYGYTRLDVSYHAENEAKTKELANVCGLSLIEALPLALSLGIDSAEKPKLFLNKLIENDIYPLNYSIRQPSLHEIFVDKVGRENHIDA